MKNHVFYTIVLFVSIILKSHAQINYSFKSEVGYLKYQNKIFTVEPGPNWQGYNLQNTDGIDINIVNGFDFKNIIFAGIGLGYYDFRGTKGLSVYSDLEYLPLKTKLSPLINIKIGYNHLWNQYQGGTSTILLELAAGLNLRFTKKTAVYAKSGILITQQSTLIPVKLGLQF